MVPSTEADRPSRATEIDMAMGGHVIAAVDALRIPVEHLARLFTAGDAEPVNAVLRRLAAMRDINLGRARPTDHRHRGGAAGQASRVNLLNRDGKGRPDGLIPPEDETR